MDPAKPEMSPVEYNFLNIKHLAQMLKADLAYTKNADPKDYPQIQEVIIKLGEKVYTVFVTRNEVLNDTNTCILCTDHKIRHAFGGKAIILPDLYMNPPYTEKRNLQIEDAVIIKSYYNCWPKFTSTGMERHYMLNVSDFVSICDFGDADGGQSVYFPEEGDFYTAVVKSYINKEESPSWLNNLFQQIYY